MQYNTCVDRVFDENRASIQDRLAARDLFCLFNIICHDYYNSGLHLASAWLHKQCTFIPILFGLCPSRKGLTRCCRTRGPLHYSTLHSAWHSWPLCCCRGQWPPTVGRSELKQGKLEDNNNKRSIHCVEKGLVFKTTIRLSVIFTFYILIQ